MQLIASYPLLFSTFSILVFLSFTLKLELRFKSQFNLKANHQIVKTADSAILFSVFNAYYSPWFKRIGKVFTNSSLRTSTISPVFLIFTSTIPSTAFTDSDSDWTANQIRIANFTPARSFLSSTSTS